MIIPTPEFDPLFAEDGIPFRNKMIQYIEREFSDVLGNKTGLLASNAGMEVISQMINNQLDSSLSKQIA